MVISVAHISWTKNPNQFPFFLFFFNDLMHVPFPSASSAPSAPSGALQHHGAGDHRATSIGPRQDQGGSLEPGAGGPLGNAKKKNRIDGK